MTANAKIKALAEIVRGIVQGLHDAAPDHCQCPLQGTDGCAYFNGAIERLDEIIEG